MSASARKAVLDQPDDDTRLAVATFLANRAKAAREITPTNGLGSRLSFADAVDSGVSYCIEPAADVIAIDGDGSGNGNALDAVRQILRAYGVSSVLLQSGGVVEGRPSERRHHLWAVLTSGAEVEPLVRELGGYVQDVGLDWRRGDEQRIRPPFTPHRTGEEMRLISPRTVEEAVRVLTPTERLGAARMPQHLPSRPKAPHRRPTAVPFPMVRLERRDLSTRIERLLRDGDTTGRYGSASEVMQAIATSALQRGWEFDEFADEMRNSANGGARHYRKQMALGSKRAERAVRRAWENAVEFVEQNAASNDVDPAVIQLVEVVGRIDWTAPEGVRSKQERQRYQRTCVTDEAVYRAHLQIAVLRGALIHDLSERDAASMAAIGSRTTIRKSHDRLEKRGLLRRTNTRVEGQVAGEWELLLPALATDPHDSHPPEGDGKANTTLAAASAPSRINGAHDLWRHGKPALGKTSISIARLIEYKPMRAEVVAAKVGRQEGTVLFHLERMKALGMVTKSRAGWRWADQDLDDIAALLKVPGRGADQARWFRKERAEFAAALAKKVKEKERKRAAALGSIGAQDAVPPAPRRRATRGASRPLTHTPTPTGGREQCGSVAGTAATESTPEAGEERIRRATRTPNPAMHRRAPEG